MNDCARELGLSYFSLSLFGLAELKACPHPHGSATQRPAGFELLTALHFRWEFEVAVEMTVTGKPASLDKPISRYSAVQKPHTTGKCPRSESTGEFSSVKY